MCRRARRAPYRRVALPATPHVHQARRIQLKNTFLPKSGASLQKYGLNQRTLSWISIVILFIINWNASNTSFINSQKIIYSNNRMLWKNNSLCSVFKLRMPFTSFKDYKTKTKVNKWENGGMQTTKYLLCGYLYICTVLLHRAGKSTSMCKNINESQKYWAWHFKKCMMWRKL